MHLPWRNRFQTGLWLALLLTLTPLWLPANATGGPAPTVAAPHGTCPTQTTPLPLPVTLNVTLQRPNAPPPDPSWAVPVDLVLYPPGDPETICHQWTLTLDQSGHWSGMLDMFTGTYDVRLRNLHTLRNVRHNLTINGPLTLAMGTLHEGDANADNFVNILDFARLRNSYFLDEGMPGFDPTADFDENNTINILDFGLLRGSYFMEGDIEVTTAAPLTPQPWGKADTPQPWGAGGVTKQAVTITVVPLTRDLAVDEVVGFSIQLDATAQPVLGLDVEMFYRPVAVGVVDSLGNPTTSLIPGPAFTTILQNRVYPAQGRLAFSAANFDEPARGVVEVARFYLKGLSPGPANLGFGSRTVAMDESARRLPLTPVNPIITVGGVGELHYYLPLGLGPRRQ